MVLVVIFTAIKPVQHKAYLFFTVERKDFSQTAEYKYNQYYGAQASDSFTSVVQGWFKDPQLIKDVLGRIDFNYLGVRKEKRQNIIISFKGNNQEYLAETLERLEDILQKRIIQYNQETGSNFVFSLMSSEIKEGSQVFSWILNFIIAISIGLFVSIMFIYLKAYSQGLVIFKEQLELLGVKNFYDYQEEYLLLDLISSKTVFLVALEVKEIKQKVISLMLNLLKDKANGVVFNFINLDGNDRNFHNNLGVSENLKNLSGVTDIVIKEDLNKYKTKLNKFNQYLAFGTNRSIKGEVVNWLEETEENNIFYCGNLLNNLNLINNSKITTNNIILFIKLGKTKLETIRKIQNSYSTKNIIIYII